MYLLLKSKYRGYHCRWVNRAEESGRPYDLILTRSPSSLPGRSGVRGPDGSGDDSDDLEEGSGSDRCGPGGGVAGDDGLVYVEVKATTSGPEGANGPFPISLPELLFAAEHRGRYQVYRVCRAGTGAASVLAIGDFYRRLVRASQLFCQLAAPAPAAARPVA